MNHVDSGGGGGGSQTYIDLDAVRRISDAMKDAGDGFDGAGSGTPSASDCGEASALVAAMLAKFTQVGARLVTEAGTVSSVVSECAVSYETTDSAQAESYLITGKSS